MDIRNGYLNQRKRYLIESGEMKVSYSLGLLGVKKELN
jgi:hypothetical protein